MAPFLTLNKSFFVGSSQVEGGGSMYDLEIEHKLVNLYRIGDRSDTNFLA